MPRLLFSSYHCYVDPSSGAAIATRDLLELLVKWAWQCRVLCGPTTDYQQNHSALEVLERQGIAYQRKACTWMDHGFSVVHLRDHALPVAVYVPDRVSRPTPGRVEGNVFLSLLDREIERYRPDIMLTYGGHWLAREMIAQATRRGVTVVFGLHNFSYKDVSLFARVNAVLVPSVFSASYYFSQLSLRAAAIPSPINWERIICEPAQEGYVTFVNPIPEKGVFVFAQIARQLGLRRPDIPLLVVEARAGMEWLTRTGVDLSGVKTLHRMGNTPDPRDFYRVSRVIVMPSLWYESFGRVAVEALINGIPVVASDRGALPEVLDGLATLIHVPDAYTRDTRAAPTSEEVRPWVETIERLWDDPQYYQEQRHFALSVRRRWSPEILGPRYDAFFRRLLPGARLESCTANQP